MRHNYDYATNSQDGASYYHGRYYRQTRGYPRTTSTYQSHYYHRKKNEDDIKEQNAPVPESNVAIEAELKQSTEGTAIAVVEEVKQATEKDSPPKMLDDIRSESCAQTDASSETFSADEKTLKLLDELSQAKQIAHISVV